MNVLLLTTCATIGLFVLCLMAYLFYQRRQINRMADNTANKVSDKLALMARSKKKDLNMLVGEAQLFLTAKYSVLFIFPGIAWVCFGGIMAPLIALCVAQFLPIYILKKRKERRTKQIEEALPNSLLMISSSLRAGSALSVALNTLVREQPGPLGEEFAILLREQKLGVDFDAAMESMAERVNIADFHMVAVALRVSREIGGNLSDILDSLANAIRTKAVLEGKIKALTAQGVLQGIVMALLPFFIGGALFFLEPEAMGKLIHTLAGQVVCIIALIMEAIGYMVIRKILAIDI